MIVFRVLNSIPELRAEPGDFVIDSPGGGVSVVRRADVSRSVLYLRASSLRPIYSASIAAEAGPAGPFFLPPDHLGELSLDS